MAAVAPVLAGTRSESRDLLHWMERVLKERERAISQPENEDTIHDLRVGLRRCRSLASVFEEVDPFPAWRAMRKSSRTLFQNLGNLRDAQVMKGWVEKLVPESNSLRLELLTSLNDQMPSLLQEAVRAAEEFDVKEWKHFGKALQKRLRLIPLNSPAALCLALERWEDAGNLHRIALRTEKSKPWHALRIGVKHFRYTVESLLPELHSAWSEDLKRLQDSLGELHDFDVLLDAARKADHRHNSQAFHDVHEILHKHRNDRVELYRQLTLGSNGLWNRWRASLPTNGKLTVAIQSRFDATARAADPHQRRSRQIARIAQSLANTLAQTHVVQELENASTKKLLRAACTLHAIEPEDSSRSGHKAARKFLQDLPHPPGWSAEEWSILGNAIRYHRGAEPAADSGRFSKLTAHEQKYVLLISGILRLARGLWKADVPAQAKFTADPSNDGIHISILGAEAFSPRSAKLAKAKHSLERALNSPLRISRAEDLQNVISLPNRAKANPAAN